MSAGSLTAVEYSLRATRPGTGLDAFAAGAANVDQGQWAADAWISASRDPDWLNTPLS